MFRVRECHVGCNEVSIAVDGVVRDKDLPYLQEIIEAYLVKNMKVFVSCAHLKQLGGGGKHFFKTMRDQIVLVDLPEYLKTEIMGDDDGDSNE